MHMLRSILWDVAQCTAMTERSGIRMQRAVSESFTASGLSASSDHRRSVPAPDARKDFLSALRPHLFGGVGSRAAKIANAASCYCLASRLPPSALQIRVKAAMAKLEPPAHRHHATRRASTPDHGIFSVKSPTRIFAPSSCRRQYFTSWRRRESRPQSSRVTMPR